MAMPTIEAPFARYEGAVLPEWIDLNGHMNLAYYTVLFDYATDLLFETIGIGRQYKDATGHGTFVVETHNRYERELLVGQKVRVASQIVAADQKRIHLAHEMFRQTDEARAATQELLFLSIDLARRRVVPFLPAAAQRLDAATAAHAGLARPDWVGRQIALAPTAAGG
jgi:acyl-CoA thioester hydrolase